VARIDFTDEDLEQFEPSVQEALLRLARQQLELKQPRQSPISPSPGLKVTEHKTPEDFDREWRARYNQGTIHVDPN
jgi:hypothetical protein